MSPRSGETTVRPMLAWCARETTVAESPPTCHCWLSGCWPPTRTPGSSGSGGAVKSSGTASRTAPPAALQPQAAATACSRPPRRCGVEVVGWARAVAEQQLAGRSVVAVHVDGLDRADRALSRAEHGAHAVRRHAARGRHPRAPTARAVEHRGLLVVEVSLGLTLLRVGSRPLRRGPRCRSARVSSPRASARRHGARGEYGGGQLWWT